MRRIRATGIIGLVLGLSGCAGTHHHHHHRHAHQPSRASAVVATHAGGATAATQPRTTLAARDCGCDFPAVPSSPAPPIPSALPTMSPPPTQVAANRSAPARFEASPPDRDQARATLPTMSPPSNQPGGDLSGRPRFEASAAGRNLARAQARPAERLVRPASSQPGEWSRARPSRLKGVAPTPPGSLPVAVPGRTGVASRFHYFPLTRGETWNPSWEYAWPDPLGVRAGQTELAQTSGNPLPITAEELDGLREASTLGESPVPTASRAQGSAVEETEKPWALQAELPSPSLPARVLPRPELAVKDETARPPGTLTLEFAELGEQPGQPNLAQTRARSGAEHQPQETMLVKHDPDEPSSWISRLAFEPAAKPDGRISRIVPIPRDRDAGPATAFPTRRPNFLSRFARRIKGAGQAFLDPDSVRREPRNFPEHGQGVEGASADQLGEAPQR